MSKKDELTKKQKEELQRLTDELMGLSAEVVEDYELNPSEISGSIVEINENSPFLDEEFKGNELESLRKIHPDAKVLVHPESPSSVIAQADMVGSTTAIIKAVTGMDAKNYTLRNRDIVSIPIYNARILSDAGKVKLVKEVKA